VYFHRADAAGIGFDRTSSGSNAVSQYAPPVAAMFQNIQTTPEEYLLWFHHVPWDYKMPSGKTLWTELVEHYDQGVRTVEQMRKTWAGLSSFIDAERFAQVSAFLEEQERDAKWWRNASIAYFQSFSKRPLPEGSTPPEHSLQFYEAVCIPYVPGDPNAPRCRRP
jgi:alpha-glucuronidase